MEGAGKDGRYCRAPPVLSDGDSRPRDLYGKRADCPGFPDSGISEGGHGNAAPERIAFTKGDGIHSGMYPCMSNRRHP